MNIAAPEQFSPIDTARQVLMSEGEALKSMAESVGVEFEHAVKLLADTKGRIIVTGMGKSGHVGRKIAATMASTGSPTQFVHPAEASHGDLGMVTSDDTLLVISNSGNTAELSDVLNHAVSLGISIISITSQGPSILSSVSTATLQLPNVPEAYPLILAPTTSTAMAMAMGDALAIALLERRNFSAAQFRALHPAGALGRQSARVRDIMHKLVPTVSQSTTMAEVLKVIIGGGFGCCGVVNDDAILLGAVTDDELRRHMSNDLMNQSVEAIMTRTPKTIRSDALVTEAMAIMNDTGVNNLFVVETDEAPMRAIGIIHVRDLLKSSLSKPS